MHAMVVFAKMCCDCSYCFDYTDIDAVCDRVVLFYLDVFTELGEIRDRVMNFANR